MSDIQLIHEYFDVFNHRDLSKMGNVLTADAELNFPNTQPLIGEKRIFKFLNILFRQYPDLVFKIQRVILQGDWAAVHWTNQGLNRRKEPYRNEGVTLLEMQAGKIKFISDFFKNTDML
jgi:ketosteroid isomerase-like protein